MMNNNSMNNDMMNYNNMNSINNNFNNGIMNNIMDHNSMGYNLNINLNELMGYGEIDPIVIFRRYVEKYKEKNKGNNNEDVFSDTSSEKKISFDEFIDQQLLCEKDDDSIIYKVEKKLAKNLIKKDILRVDSNLKELLQVIFDNHIFIQLYHLKGSELDDLKKQRETNSLQYFETIRCFEDMLLSSLKLDEQDGKYVILIEEKEEIEKFKDDNTSNININNLYSLFTKFVSYMQNILEKY